MKLVYIISIEKHCLCIEENWKNKTKQLYIPISSTYIFFVVF